MKKIPFLFLLFVLLSGNLHAQEKMSLEAVLAGIKSNDEKIKTIEAVFSIILPDDNNRELCPNQEWGKFGEKEYIVSKYYFKDEINPGKLNLLDQEFRFDGNRMTTLGITWHPNAAPYIGGLIKQPKSDEFLDRVTPWHFLGGALTNKRVLLSKVLKEAQNLRLEGFNGTTATLSCDYFTYQMGEKKEYPESLKVTVDATKGFRAVKMETFCENNGFKVLHAQFSDIVLEKRDGDIYVPVSGIHTVYTIDDFKPKGNLSREQILNMPLEERKKNIEPILKPLGLGPHKMIVKDIVVNKPIAPEKFVVKFPAGTAVYDEFSQTGYKVGAATEKSQPQPESADREK